MVDVGNRVKPYWWMIGKGLIVLVNVEKGLILLVNDRLAWVGLIFDANGNRD